jgi:hypothetical protein
MQMLVTSAAMPNCLALPMVANALPGCAPAECSADELDRVTRLRAEHAAVSHSNESGNEYAPEAG